MYAQEISTSRFLELCLCVVVSETSPYFTRALYFLRTSLTTFSSRHSQFTHNILAVLPSLTENYQTLLTAVSFYLLMSSIPYILHEECSRVCTWYLLSPSRKEWPNRDISAVLL